MPKKPLKSRLYSFLEREYPAWIAKGELCDIARAKANATGEHTGRRLRELHESGAIERKLERGHAWYRFRKPEPLVKIKQLSLTSQ